MKSNWISIDETEKLFIELPKTFSTIPIKLQAGIGFDHGLHFTGGEPFLNYPLLLELTQLAHKHNIPGLFVETNCFWADDKKTAAMKLETLKKAGMSGILISINPFNIENIDFQRIETAYAVSKKIFGSSTIVYQRFFMQLFESIGLKGKLPLSIILQKIQFQDLMDYIEILPMGRAVYLLNSFFKKYDARMFFGQNCLFEFKNNRHIHIDNYFNYIPGFCAGISLGNALDLSRLLEKGINLKNYPVIEALVTDIEELYNLASENNYEPLRSGYISKCHLCVDIRKHLVKIGKEFNELKPSTYYEHLIEK